MIIWGENVPEDALSSADAAFLAPFAERSLPSLEEMWAQLDAVWHTMNLDTDCTDAALAAYYSHPVWLLNGLYTAVDPASVAHRRAIARWLAARGLKRVGDFGGGLGELARAIAGVTPEACVDVIEPHASALARRRTADLSSVRWCDDFDGEYDAVVAQDVLEHVADPVGTAAALIETLRPGGIAIFANCFLPVIQCHLAETFHLRHTFGFVIRPLGVAFCGRIPGAEHVHAYIRLDDAAVLSRARSREAIVRRIGPALNVAMTVAQRLRNNMTNGSGG